MGLPIAGWGRRKFLQGSLALAGLVLLAGCGIVPPRPQPTRVDRIGYLGHDASLTLIPGAFVEGLQDLGYVDGQNAVGSVRRDCDSSMPTPSDHHITADKVPEHLPHIMPGGTGSHATITR